MDQPITASFQWTLPEMQLAQRLHLRLSKSVRRQRRRMLLIAIIWLALGIGLAKGGHEPVAYVPCFILGAVMLVWRVAMPFIVRRDVAAAYGRKQDRDMVVNFEFTDDRISTWSEVVSSEFLWRKIIRAQRTPLGFLLYPTDRSFFWLPAHAFKTQDDIERLAQACKANVSEYVEGLRT